METESKIKIVVHPKNCLKVLCVGYPQRWIINAAYVFSYGGHAPNTQIKTLAHSFATPTQNAKHHQETINRMLNIGRLVVYPKTSGIF